MGKKLFAEIVAALPDDAKIVGMSDDLDSQTCILLVHSETFKEVAEGDSYNEITTHIARAPGGLHRLDYLDMSQALEEPMKFLGLSALLQKHSEEEFLPACKRLRDQYLNAYPDLTRRMSKSEVATFGHGSQNNKIRRWSDYVVKLPDGLKVNFDAPCFHEWRDYVGLSERYRYCAKCDQKEAS